MDDCKFTFDDVLIEPRFSSVNSRSEVDLMVQVGNLGKFLPIMSSNMDTVTGTEMAVAMADLGALGCLHRFMTVEQNLESFVKVERPCAVSFGLGDEELHRAVRLYQNGARLFVLDVAHAAQAQVVQQYGRLSQACMDAFIIVGNFAGVWSLDEFIQRLGFAPHGVKVGIGPGSACTTRIKTGVGYPQLSAVQEIASYMKNNHPGSLVMADGGMKTSGDIAKALGAGADMVMLGGMLAGTTETPGQKISKGNLSGEWTDYKIYRGSASKDSYDAQGKNADFRTAEGEAFTVPFKGPVKGVIQDILGGLRSAFTYVGARNLQEFQELVNFVHISSATIGENEAHGKKN